MNNFVWFVWIGGSIEALAWIKPELPRFVGYHRLSEKIKRNRMAQWIDDEFEDSMLRFYSLQEQTNLYFKKAGWCYRLTFIFISKGLPGENLSITTNQWNLTRNDEYDHSKKYDHFQIYYCYLLFEYFHVMCNRKFWILILNSEY